MHVDIYSYIRVDIFFIYIHVAIYSDIFVWRYIHIFVFKRDFSYIFMWQYIHIYSIYSCGIIFIYSCGDIYVHVQDKTCGPILLHLHVRDDCHSWPPCQCRRFARFCQQEGWNSFDIIIDFAVVVISIRNCCPSITCGPYWSPLFVKRAAQYLIRNLFRQSNQRLCERLWCGTWDEKSAVKRKVCHQLDYRLFFFLSDFESDSRIDAHTQCQTEAIIQDGWVHIFSSRVLFLWINYPVNHIGGAQNTFQQQVFTIFGEPCPISHTTDSRFLVTCVQILSASFHEPIIQSTIFVSNEILEICEWVQIICCSFHEPNIQSNIIIFLQNCVQSVTADSRFLVICAIIASSFYKSVIQSTVQLYLCQFWLEVRMKLQFELLLLFGPRWWLWPILKLTTFLRAYP